MYTVQYGSAAFLIVTTGFSPSRKSAVEVRSGRVCSAKTLVCVWRKIGVQAVLIDPGAVALGFLVGC